MKAVRWLWLVRLAVAAAALAASVPAVAYAEDTIVDIREWQVQWILADTASDTGPSDVLPWMKAGVRRPMTDIPDGTVGVWVRVEVPSTAGWSRPGLLIDRMYGLDVSVYNGDRLLSDSRRAFRIESNKLLVPIDSSAHPQELLIRIVTTGERAGIVSAVRAGDFTELSNRFVTRELPNLLLGTSIIFLASIMLLFSGYLQRKQRRPWISLCLIALTLGTMILTYSPLPYVYFEAYGNFLWMLFDISLIVLVPAFNAYIDHVFEGKYVYFTRFRFIQTVYSLFCLAVLALHVMSGERYYGLYLLFQNTIMGMMILTQLLLIIALSFHTAVKGNRDAVILSAGVILFALSAAADLTFYYISEKIYILFMWKIGVVLLIASLVTILARRISSDYTKLLNYSKELEFFNHSLQRTEKLKIISDLAASIAHEVRNPLQVTRGFLQLLAERTDEKSKSYFELATNELDRASDIITDFLTFAKPELDTVHVVDVSRELRKIEAMMNPMVSMHGGILTLQTEDDLYIYGNASKFKQALINLIKNSSEAIGADGRIDIRAGFAATDIYIQITDNGHGMDEEEIARLGEPFFSTKSKGTGLGMMVTFRIVEIMKGKIQFRSVKAKGTEVTLRFPQVVHDQELPGVAGA